MTIGALRWLYPQSFVLGCVPGCALAAMWPLPLAGSSVRQEPGAIAPQSRLCIWQTRLMLGDDGTRGDISGQQRRQQDKQGGGGQRRVAPGLQACCAKPPAWLRWGCREVRAPPRGQHAPVGKRGQR